MMKKRACFLFTLIAVLCAAALTFTACGDKGSDPKDVSVTGVTLTVATGDTRGAIETEHTLAYTATAGATVTVTVQKSNVTAAETDYTYTEASKKLVFHTAGSYTITVKAEKDGKSDSGSVTIAVTDPAAVEIVEVTDVTLPQKGIVGAEYTLAYTATEGAAVTVTVKKDKEDAAQSDYTYTEETKKFVFHTAGAYAVTVKAEKGNDSDQKTVHIVIGNTGVYNVAIAAKAQNVKGKAGQTHVLSYEVSPADAQVSVKAEKQNGEEWEDTQDAVYTDASKELVFRAAGTYRVTVSTTDADPKSDFATIEITDFTAEVAGELTGGKMMGTELTLSYTVTPEPGYTGETAVRVTVLKKGANGEYADADDGDYTYTEASKKLVFRAVGAYRVRIACTNADLVSVPHDIDIEVVTLSDPRVALSASADTVEEGKSVTLTKSVRYDTGDEKESESVTVEYSANGTGYAEAPAANYTWADDAQTEFKPLLAGSYRITLTAKGTLTQAASDSVTLSATASPIALVLGAEQLTNGWVRMAVSANKSVTYNVNRASGEGNAYTDGYDVAVTGENGATATVDAANHTVTVTAGSDSNTANVVVTYTHKVTNAKVSLTVPVSMVSNVDTAPVLGEDPFGDTYDVVAPSIGLQLYYDATANNEQVAASAVSYVVTSQNLKFGDDTAMTDRASIQTFQNRPYILVANYADSGEDGPDKGNTAHGTITVKMTVTVNDQVAVATKVFTVTPLGKNGDKVATVGINDYLSHIFDIKDTNYEKIIDQDVFQNMVATKDGIFYHARYGSGSLNCVEPNGADNFQVDFDYTILERIGNNKSSFCVNFRTGAWTGYCGSQMAFYVEGDGTMINSGYWGAKKEQHWSDGPTATIGKTIHIRLKHTVENSVATYLWQWSEDGTTYNHWMDVTADTSTENENIGAPVYALQFNYEDGRFIMSGAKLTIL